MKTTSGRARVVVTDDQVMIRKGLRATLTAASGFELVGEAVDGPSTLHAVAELSPDLVLIDLVAKGVSTLPLITEIKQRYPAAKVAVYTVHRSREDVTTALRAGADGYLLKDLDIHGVLEAMSIILQGHTFLSHELIGLVVGAYTVAQAEDLAEGPGVLSARENQVLKLVAGGRTSKQIARHLVISPRTVEKHRARLMRKLGVSSIAALMTVAINCGLIEGVEAHTSACGANYLYAATGCSSMPSPAGNAVLGDTWVRQVVRSPSDTTRWRGASRSDPEG